MAPHTEFTLELSTSNCAKSQKMVVRSVQLFQLRIKCKEKESDTFQLNEETVEVFLRMRQHGDQ